MRHVSALPLILAIPALAACSDSLRPPERPSDRSHNARVADVSPAFAVSRLDLGTLGGRESRAIGNNDNGVVVGWSLNSAGQKRAFKWTAGGGMHALGTLAGGRPCQANHVTENGQVAGFCLNASGKQHAVLWSAAGVIRDLGTLPGGITSQATDVNDAGVVVGTSDVLIRGTHRTHAFKWTAAGGMRDLGVVPPSPGCDAAYSRAERINKSGQIAGTSLPGSCEFNEEAVRWSPAGAIQQLFPPNGDSYSHGHGINDAGHVAGNGELEAALWKPGSGWRVLGTLPGGDLGSTAFSVNNSDQVVGASSVSGGRNHAFVWTQAAGMQDLGTLAGGTNSQANDINNHTPRQVVGWSSRTGGAIHAALWTLH
jgi:probable HAF family extracellular repeat protein